MEHMEVPVHHTHLTPAHTLAATDEIRQLALEIMDDQGAPWDTAHALALDELLAIAIDVQDDVRYRPVVQS